MRRWLKDLIKESHETPVSMLAFIIVVVWLLALMLVLGSRVHCQPIPGAAARYLDYWRSVQKETGQVLFDRFEYYQLRREIELRGVMSKPGGLYGLGLDARLGYRPPAENPKTEGIPLSYLWLPSANREGRIK